MRKQKLNWFLASTMIAMIASVASAKGDVCDAALDMHQTIASALAKQSNEIWEEKKKQEGLERYRANCEWAKFELDRENKMRTIIDEDERVCSKKIIAKRLRCDSKCQKKWVAYSKDLVTENCDEYEKEKKAEAERAAKK